jgi:large subunit ribosomal protein L15
MTANKRKKNSRQRGNHTHGWGAMKKHRGSGNRGGAGNAGSGKRADSKKPSVWQNRSGKYGFTSHKTNKKTINIVYLEEHIDLLLATKKAKQDSQGISINLNDLGVNKLLSKGKINKKLLITCEAASVKAIESVKAAGGEVILPKKEESNGPKEHLVKSS